MTAVASVPVASDQPAQTETVKPVPVRIGRGRWSQLLFAGRRAVDLQLETIWRFLRPQFAGLQGRMLDVGCGEMPFAAMLPPAVEYVGIDVAEAMSFGMSTNPAIHTFDGRAIPFPSASYDHVLCTEVLEHAEDPEALMTEMHRVLKPGGSLIMTVPFSARVHHAPYDFHRFTRYRLRAMAAPFSSVAITARGTDLATIANKLIVLEMALMKLSPALLWRAPLALCVAPIALVFLVAAHASIRLGFGSTDDPLGYAVLATK